MNKILVVDDAEDVRFLLTRLLHLGGYETETAEDGKAALEQIAQSRPDLILLDVMMPRMNGIEMLSILRHDPQLNRLPVMLYTAMTDAKLLETARELGIQDLIVKGSIDGSDLLNRIARQLSGATTQ